MLARLVGVWVFVTVGLLGLLTIAYSLPPVRVAIAVALAGLVAVPLTGLAVLIGAAPLAPALAVWLAVWGPWSRPVNVAAVGWPVLLAVVVHRRQAAAGNGVDRAAADGLGDGHE